MESNGILGQRPAGLGGGLLGGGVRRGALMGSGRLASPAGGPQEAIACGLALGRPAIAAVRWADRLRERRPSPCGLPSTSPHVPSLCTDVEGLGSNKLCKNKQRRGFNISKLHLSDIFHWIALIESICGSFSFRVKHVSTSLLPD